jgi:hemolysin III
MWPEGERFNGITHLTGAIVALIGGIVLIVQGALAGDPWKVVSFSIYGAMLLCLYLASTLYHSLRGRAKRIWCKFDHCAIYLLIAGSYTPFALVSLRGAWGWSLFGTVWGLALLGIAQEIWLAKGLRIFSLVLYVAMGWLAIIAVAPLIEALTWEGFRWLAAGGLVYTIGIVFYATDEKWAYGHGVWHLFVLAGSACHYFTVLEYVA